MDFPDPPTRLRLRQGRPPTFGTGCPQQGPFIGHALRSAATGSSPAKLNLFGAAGVSSSAISHGWIFVGGKL